MNVSVASSITALTSATPFRIDDPLLGSTGMSHYSSWADECEQESNPPMHGSYLGD